MLPKEDWDRFFGLLRHKIFWNERPKKVPEKKVHFVMYGQYSVTWIDVSGSVLNSITIYYSKKRPGVKFLDCDLNC